MLRDFDKDRIALVKSNGDLNCENVPALVSGQTIFVQDEKFPVEVGDHLLRKPPSGLVEDYVVVDPVFYSKALVGMDSHFQIKVRKHGSPASKESIVQGITNNFHGANSRVNINSVDNSVNISTDISPAQIEKFIAELSPVIEYLPEDLQGKIRTQLDVLSEEGEKSAPS